MRPFEIELNHYLPFFIVILQEQNVICPMKNNRVLIATVLVLCLIGTIVVFARRGKHPLPAVLHRADSLCGVNPRQALRVLDSIAPEMNKGDEYVRNKYALLTIKARDKAFITHTDSTLDSIKEIVKFYDAHGTENERIEAYYYQGSVYRDLHDFPQTVRNYTNALDIAEAAKEGFDTALVAKVCSQLSFVFFEQKHYKKSLEYAQKEYDYLQTVGKLTARSIMDVATSFFHAEKLDSAFLYQKKTFEYLQEHRNFEHNMDILAELFSNYAQAGDSAKADMYHALFESRVRKDHLPPNYYATKAIYFKHRNRTDSAIHYYKDLYEKAPNLDDKCYAARNLLKLYKQVGNDGEALRYGLAYAEMQDSVWESLNVQQTADAYNEYKYRRNVEQEAAAYKESAALWRRSIIVLAAAVVAVLLIAGIFLLYRKRARKAIEAKEKELRRKDKAIEDKEAQLRGCSEIITQNNVLIESQKEEIKEIRDRNTRLTRVRLQEHVETSTPRIHAKFHKAATGLYKPTEEDWQELYEAVEKEDKDFLIRIQQHIKRINRKKIKVIYLLRLGLLWTEIQHVMELPRSTAFRLTKELTRQTEGLLDHPEQQPARAGGAKSEK